MASVLRHARRFIETCNLDSHPDSCFPRFHAIDFSTVVPLVLTLALALQRRNLQAARTLYATHHAGRCHVDGEDGRWLQLGGRGHQSGPLELRAVHQLGLSGGKNPGKDGGEKACGLEKGREINVGTISPTMAPVVARVKWTSVLFMCAVKCLSSLPRGICPSSHPNPIHAS
jgi:hypothetical protein